MPGELDGSSFLINSVISVGVVSVNLKVDSTLSKFILLKMRKLSLIVIQASNRL
jgi:hypothetical protein